MTCEEPNPLTSRTELDDVRNCATVFPYPVPPACTDCPVGSFCLSGVDQSLSLQPLIAPPPPAPPIESCPAVALVDAQLSQTIVLSPAFPQQYAAARCTDGVWSAASICAAAPVNGVSFFSAQVRPGTRVCHVYVQVDGNAQQLPFGDDFDVYLGPAAGVRAQRCSAPTIRAPRPFERFSVTATCDCAVPVTASNNWVSVARATPNTPLILSEVRVCETPAAPPPPPIGSCASCAADRGAEYCYERGLQDEASIQSCVARCFPQGVPLDCRYIDRVKYPSITITCGLTDCHDYFSVVPNTNGVVNVCVARGGECHRSGDVICSPPPSPPPLPTHP